MSGYNLANLFKYMHALNYKDAQVLRALGNELKSRKFLQEIDLNSKKMEISADRLALILFVLGELKYTENVPLVDFLISQIRPIVHVFNITSLQQILQGLILLQYKDVKLVTQIYDISRKNDGSFWGDMVPHLLHAHAIFLIDLPDKLVHYLDENIQKYEHNGLFCGLVHSLAIAKSLREIHLQKCLEYLCQQPTLNNDDLTLLGAGLCYWKYIKKGGAINVNIENIQNSENTQIKTDSKEEQKSNFNMDLSEYVKTNSQYESKTKQHDKLQEQSLNIQLDAINCWINYVQIRTSGLFVRDVAKTFREMGVDFLQFVPLELGVEIGDIMIFQKCVLVFGFNAFTKTQPLSLLGDSVFRIELLKSLGYDVSYVSQHEWQDLDNQERIEYLKKKIEISS
eukprot:TRINITY_DN8575_c0_g1_i2.p1 TRINITY_DN8575_c0_g1~~TRINITY_DN8575_c0_g1_i2.p1  ORF type:complete len:415 (-),score=51.86 TRINITY_DN8575_c0_g1_i2:58-1248(-)